jgi:hypothetical protein
MFLVTSLATLTAFFRVHITKSARSINPEHTGIFTIFKTRTRHKPIRSSNIILDHQLWHLTAMSCRTPDNVWNTGRIWGSYETVADPNITDAFCKFLSLAFRFVAIFEKNTDDSRMWMCLSMFQATPTTFSPYLTIDYNRHLSNWGTDSHWPLCFEEELFPRPQFESHIEVSPLLRPTR